MTFFLLLLVLAAALGFLTLRGIAHDARGTRRPPQSHLDERSLPGHLS